MDEEPNRGMEIEREGWRGGQRARKAKRSMYRETDESGRRMGSWTEGQRAGSGIGRGRGCSKAG